MLHLILALGIFATAIPLSKYLLMAVSLPWYVALRTLCAGLILLGVYHRKREDSSGIITSQLIKRLFIISLFLTFIPHLLKAYSLKHLTAAKTSFFQILSPFVSAFFSYIFLGHRLLAMQWLGIACACAGFYYAMIPDGIGTFWQGLYWYPCLASLFALIAIRGGLTLLQNLLQESGHASSLLNGITHCIAGGLSIIVALADGAPIIYNHQIPVVNVIGVSLYVLIVGTVLWSTFYAYCLRHYTVTFLALMEFATPFFVSMYGHFFLDEPLTTSFFIALALTFIGLYIFYAALERSVPTSQAQQA